jgi:hypothetical protein
MHEQNNTAPNAAQPPDLIGGACAAQSIEAQRLRDEAWFRDHPERTLLARLLTVADLDGLDEIDCTLADIPPGYEHAVVIGKNSYGGCEGPIAVPTAAVAGLDAMSDGDILLRLGRGARDFYRFVHDNELVYAVADQLSRRRNRRPDWPPTCRNAPRTKAARIAKLDLLRRTLLGEDAMTDVPPPAKPRSEALEGALQEQIARRVEPLDRVMASEPRLTIGGLMGPLEPGYITGRAKLLAHPAEFEAACEYICAGIPRTPGRRPYYSYSLKHDAESWGGTVRPGRPYVSNGAMIAAAIACGWEVVRRDRAGLNAWLRPPKGYVRSRAARRGRRS